ncbi:ECF RNA polymerase sigma factor SigK [mine drainage metagenome]|uniref:ECF RNA polymerase sigma factor SigK n=1 Tax=mine drainage metagenome TaxID=410659 RepID=A0A1J5TRW6_9ZZZZ
MRSRDDNETAAEEAFLLARVGSGDRDSFRELYARYSVPLFSLVVRFVGDRGTAEELLQDVFVKLWRGAPDYDPKKSRPFTWAVTITRRVCIDHLRRHRHEPALQEFSETALVADGGRETVRSRVEAQEDSERLRGALAGLPAPQRQALELALFSSLTHTEIAGRLKQPVGTIKSWIRRGLLDLGNILSKTTP